MLIAFIIGFYKGNYHVSKIKTINFSKRKKILLRIGKNHLIQIFLMKAI